MKLTNIFTSTSIILAVTLQVANAGAIKEIGKKLVSLGKTPITAKTFTGNDYSYDTYFKKNWEKSDLDQIEIRALSEGGDRGVLDSLDDKITELHMRAHDLTESVAYGIRTTGTGRADRMVYTEVKSATRLLAHIHVLIRKQNIELTRGQRVDMLKANLDLLRVFEGKSITNLSYSEKRALNDFENTVLFVFNDLLKISPE